MIKKLKIGDLVEFKNTHLLILDFLALEGIEKHPSIKVAKVIEYPENKVELYIVKNNKIQDKVVWGWISEFQKLSEEFIREFQNKVYWGCIPRNKNISDEVKDKFRKEGKLK